MISAVPVIIVSMEWKSIIYTVFAGVFAVVSLMIGSVVDKADCSFESTNSSHLPFESSFNYTLSTESTFVDDFIANEIEKCKVRHALTVTFIVGIMQVLQSIMSCFLINVWVGG